MKNYKNILIATLSLVLASIIFGCSSDQNTSPETKEDISAFSASVAMERNGPGRAAYYDYEVSDTEPKLLWKFKSDISIPTEPVGFEDTVYFGTGKGYLYALDINSGEERWRIKKGEYAYGFAISSNMLVFSSSDGIHCIDVKDGQERWHFDTGEEWYSSITIMSDIVLVGTLDNIYALTLEDGKEKWRKPYRAESGISVEDGLTYFGGVQEFHAIDMKSGQDKWSLKSSGIISSYSMVEDGTVYFDNAEGDFVALDTISGKEKWRTEIGPSISGESSPSGGPGIFFNAFKSLRALDESGKLMWTYDKTQMSSPPITAKDKVLAADEHGLMAFDAATGREIWKFKTEGQVAYSPTITPDGTMLFGDMDGNFYAIK